MDHFAQIQKEFIRLAYPVPEESVMGKLRRWFSYSQLSNKNGIGGNLYHEKNNNDIFNVIHKVSFEWQRSTAIFRMLSTIFVNILREFA